jgi:hypothetical protein
VSVRVDHDPALHGPDAEINTTFLFTSKHAQHGPHPASQGAQYDGPDPTFQGPDTVTNTSFFEEVSLKTHFLPPAQ